MYMYMHIQISMSQELMKKEAKHVNERALWKGLDRRKIRGK